MNTLPTMPEAGESRREHPRLGEGTQSEGRTLSVLISTHNRAELLKRTLRFLDQARRPTNWTIEVLVVANACTDGTLALLQSRIGSGGTVPACSDASQLPMRWIAEPAIGKSRALNCAIPNIRSELVAFVDDDHRVDPSYLQSICNAAVAYPEAEILCGRILPDWDGSEPAWVHDTSAYRIYPLPVPRYDLGNLPIASPQDQTIPGGGNIVVRSNLFARVGEFATDFGPVGDNLGGAEDREWIERAIAAGARLQYVPDIVQYHYADPARLTLSYIIRKAYERSASVVRLSAANAREATVPRYMLAKTTKYLLLTLGSLDPRKRRFHMVRLAASVGEVKGRLQARNDLKRHAARADRSDA